MVKIVLEKLISLYTCMHTFMYAYICLHLEVLDVGSRNMTM